MKKHIAIAIIIGCLWAVFPAICGAQTPPDYPDAVATPDRPTNGIGISLYTCYTSLQQAIMTSTGNMYGAFTGAFRPLATTIVALYVAILGLKMIKGEVQAPKKALTTIALLIVVTTIVFSPGAWNSWIAGPILGTVQGTSNFLLAQAGGASGGNVYASLSQALDQIMTVSTKINASTSAWDIVGQIEGLIAQIVLAAAFIAVIVTFMLINIMSWFAIYIMMVFGGICLYFAAYDATRHIFWAWLRAVCNYGLVIVFASLIMGICQNMITTQVAALSSQDYGTLDPIFNNEFITTVAACVLTWCMLLRAPDFAAALSGGSAGNTAGIAGVVSMTTGAIYGGARYAMASRFKGVGGKMAQSFRDGMSGGGASTAAGNSGGTASARKGIQNN